MPSSRPVASGPFVALAVAVLAACGATPPTRVGAPRSRPPNVLLISLDSVRRDFLSCYGHRPAHAPSTLTTPNLDRLAGEGARFARAYATSSWTLPSHIALMTGLPDLVHAIEVDSLSLAAGHRTLAEDLAAAGYRTAGFFSGPYLDQRFGFDRGFERYEARYGADLEAVALREREWLAAVRAARSRAEGGAIAEAMRRHRAALDELERVSHRDVSSAAVTESVLAEIAAAHGDDRPWFVFAHYFDPHYDYTPPSPWDTRFDPDYAGEISGENLLLDPRISVEEPTALDPHARRRTIAERDLEHVRALYEGEIAWTDSQIGRILTALGETGEIDRTVVVVTADHGDEFFEHAHLGHRQNLFEESLRIPLIVRHPAVVAPGSVPDGVVSLADVRGAILDLVGSPPDGSTGRGLFAGETVKGGRSFGRLIDVHPVHADGGLRGRKVTVEESFLRWPIKVVRTRSWVEPRGPQASEVERRMAADAERARGRDALLAWIDLDAEPSEPPAAFSSEFGDPRARSLLEEFHDAYPGWLERRGAPSSVAAGEADLRRLRALGYLGGDQSAARKLVESLAISAPRLPGRP